MSTFQGPARSSPLTPSLSAQVPSTIANAFNSGFSIHTDIPSTMPFAEPVAAPLRPSSLKENVGEDKEPLTLEAIRVLLRQESHFQAQTVTGQLNTLRQEIAQQISELRNAFRMDLDSAVETFNRSLYEHRAETDKRITEQSIAFDQRLLSQKQEFEAILSELKLKLEEVQRSSSAGPSQLDKDLYSWLPTKVVLTGWVLDWNSRSQQLIDKSTALNVLRDLQAHATELTGGLVNWEDSQRIPDFNGFMKIELFLLSPGFRQAAELKALLDRGIDKYKVEIRGIKPIVKIEVRPDMIQLNRAAARAMGFMSSQGINTQKDHAEQVVKPVWVTGAVQVKHIDSGSILACFSAARGWTFDKQRWDSCFPGLCARRAAQFFS